MTDPKIAAREIIFGEWHDHTTVWKKMRPEHLKLHEQRIAQALLSERTTAYKAGMERAAEIAESDVAFFGDGKLHPLHQREKETAQYIAQAIRTEANKEIK